MESLKGMTAKLGVPKLEGAKKASAAMMPRSVLRLDQGQQQL